MDTHVCACTACRMPANSVTKELHGLMNLFLAQLDQQQGMLYVGLEARRRGPGSERTLALVFGWEEQAVFLAQRQFEQQAQAEGLSMPERDKGVEELQREKTMAAVPAFWLQAKTRGFRIAYPPPSKTTP